MDTGFAFFVPKYRYHEKYKSSKNLSVYTTEMLAILYAIEWTARNRYINAIILSDSVSVLRSLMSMKSSRPDIMFKIMKANLKIKQQGRSVVFMWVPGHEEEEMKKLIDMQSKL